MEFLLKLILFSPLSPVGFPLPSSLDPRTWTPEPKTRYSPLDAVFLSQRAAFFGVKKTLLPSLKNGTFVS